MSKQIIEVDIETLPFKTEEFKQQWIEWLHDRRDRRIKPYSPRGLKGAFKKLVRLSSNDATVAIQIIQESIDNGWQGLFALKPQFNGNTTRRNTEKPQPAGNVAPGGFGQL